MTVNSLDEKQCNKGFSDVKWIEFILLVNIEAIWLCKVTDIPISKWEILQDLKVLSQELSYESMILQDATKLPSPHVSFLVLSNPVTPEIEIHLPLVDTFSTCRVIYILE